MTDKPTKKENTEDREDTTFRYFSKTLLRIAKEKRENREAMEAEELTKAKK